MNNCPQCHLFLNYVELQGRSLQFCSCCSGLWVPGEIASSLSNKDVDDLCKADFGTNYVSSNGMYDGLQLPCPVCKTRFLGDSSQLAGESLQNYACCVCNGIFIKYVDRTAYTPSSSPTAKPEKTMELPPAVEKPVVIAESETDNRVRLEPPIAKVQAPTAPKPTNAHEALEVLLDGNKRFASQKPLSRNLSEELRMQLHTEGQKPFAVVVGCSDSRVPPETVFDQGLGDLFVVRTAGGAFGEIAMAGIAYAIRRFQAPLVVVMGHTGCSAVKAAMDEDPEDPYLKSIVEMIRPAIRSQMGKPGDHYENSIRANAIHIAQTITKQTPVRALFESHVVTIQAMLYHTDTGLVELLPTSIPLPEVEEFDLGQVEPTQKIVVNATDTREKTFAKVLPRFRIKPQESK